MRDAPAGEPPADRLDDDSAVERDDEPHLPLPPLTVDLTGPGRGDPRVQVHVWPATTGASRRPVIVALHAWTDSGLGFGPLATALGRRWTVVAPDAPGHGGTPWQPAARYHLTEHTAGALTVLDRLPEVAGHRSDVVLLGHGFGALTASRLAAARPDVVRHLVLEDPARAALRRVRSAAAVRGRVLALRTRPVDDVAPTGPASDRPWLDRPWLDWPADELAPWLDGVRAASLEALSVPVDWGEPLGALLADVACPATIVHGSLRRGGLVSAVAARRCAAACRAGCETVQLDAGHHPRREAREPFIAVLASVLGRYEVR